jgi:hypothetical protein
MVTFAAVWDVLATAPAEFVLVVALVVVFGLLGIAVQALVVFAVPVVAVARSPSQDYISSSS